MQQADKNGSGGDKRHPSRDDRWSKLKVEKKAEESNAKKKSPAREDRPERRSSLDIYQKNRPDPRRNIYGSSAGAGPSQRPAVIAALAEEEEEEEEEEEDEEDDESRLPAITEDSILHTSGDDFKRNAGRRDDHRVRPEEEEVALQGSDLLENTPVEMITDLGEAIEHIKQLRDQIEEYKKINDELRRTVAKKEEKINRTSSALERCLAHRAKLERRNGRIRRWLEDNATGWEAVLDSSDEEKTPPPCPPLKKRAGTPAGGQRTAAAYNMSPSSSESKKSGHTSPEIFRRSSGDASCGSTPEVMRTPTLSPSLLRKRSISYLEESGGSKRRRSSTPPPSVHLSEEDEEIQLASPIIETLINRDPPDDDGEDDDDDDDESSNGIPSGGKGKSVRRPQRRPRILGPRQGSFIPPPPYDAPEQPRLWARGPGYTTSLRSLVPLNLNVEDWFKKHIGRI